MRCNWLYRADCPHILVLVFPTVETIRCFEEMKQGTLSTWGHDVALWADVWIHMFTLCHWDWTAQAHESIFLEAQLGSPAESAKC